MQQTLHRMVGFFFTFSEKSYHSLVPTIRKYRFLCNKYRYFDVKSFTEN